MIDYNDFIVVIVSYFSYGWTQQCVDSLLNFFPECRILAVDNNPSKYDQPMRASSFRNSRSVWPYNTKKKIILNWGQFCELEREWINSHTNIATIQTPLRFSHGQSLNLATRYCAKEKIKKMVLIEPDCTIYGTAWLHNLLGALDQGYWMASGRMNNKWLHPCPSAWLVDSLKQVSFNCVDKGADIYDDFFDKYFGFENQNEKMNFVRKYPGWDTGVKAWYEFAKLGRAKHVGNNGLKHHCGKSSRADFRIRFL